MELFSNPDNPNDMLVEIFNQQRSHMEKYAEIEDNNGLLQTPDIPVNIQDRFGQARLKDFAWRITEEMGEALQNLEGTLDMFKLADYHEELSDVLHFLTEFTILAGLKPADLIRADVESDGSDYLVKLYAQTRKNIPWIDKYNPTLQDTTYLTGVFVKELALTCNLLKNKPWKQTTRETDPEVFKYRLIEVWMVFITIAIVFSISPRELYNLYFRKSDINKKRQETGY